MFHIPDLIQSQALQTLEPNASSTITTPNKTANSSKAISTKSQPKITIPDWTVQQVQVQSILSLLIGCVGVVGNCLNFLVLHVYPTSHITFGGECTARVNLLGLAVADFLVCLASLPLGNVQRKYRTHNIMLYYTLIGPGLVTFFLTVSVWMVLLMSVVRYLVVCKPLTSRACLSARYMIKVICLIYVVAFLFHIPSFLDLTYMESGPMYTSRGNLTNKSNGTITRRSNDTRPISQPSTDYIYVVERVYWNDETVRLIYNISQIIFSNIGPFIGVVISNVSVIRACHRSDACRNNMSFDKPISPSAIHSSQTPNIGCNPRHCLTHSSAHLQRGSRNQLSANHIWRLGSNSRPPIQRIQQRATNRVTPLLLAVILAFLLFTAPFGIVHLACLQIIRGMGSQVRDNQNVYNLYMVLNMIVGWTNVVQLLGCASNFFLYFLVSTTFRKTTKRSFMRLYKKVRNFHCPTPSHFCGFVCSDSEPVSMWESDTRTNELRKKLNASDPLQINCTLPPKDKHKRSSTDRRDKVHNLLKFRLFNRSDQNTSYVHCCHNNSCQHISMQQHINSSPIPCLHSSTSDKMTCSCLGFGQGYQRHYHSHPAQTYNLDSTLQPSALLICPKCSHAVSGYVSLPESQLCMLKPTNKYIICPSKQPQGQTMTHEPNDPDQECQTLESDKIYSLNHSTNDKIPCTD